MIHDRLGLGVAELDAPPEELNDAWRNCWFLQLVQSRDHRFDPEHGRLHSSALPHLATAQDCQPGATVTPVS